MKRIPDQRSTPRLVGAWAWWMTQCLVITGLQLIPGVYATSDYPRRPRRDCSDLRLAEYDREDARDRAQSQWRSVRTRIQRLLRRTNR